MTNSFHQLVLSEETGRKLAVQTPWGLVQPRFLPEGVSPASGYLQSYVMEMFKDFEQWAITIFDNILLLAHNKQDACDKLEKFLERCASRNVILKMQKTWLGFSSVKFFGYKAGEIFGAMRIQKCHSEDAEDLVRIQLNKVFWL